MDGIKPPFGSLTINSAIVSVAASVLDVAGINLGPETGANINAVIAGIGAAIAIYGRIRASKRIGRPAISDPG